MEATAALLPRKATTADGHTCHILIVSLFVSRWNSKRVFTPDVAVSYSPLSSLEVILAHWNILEEESDQSPITPQAAVANVVKRRRHRACTNSCVDLAIVCGQAVPLVEVGERLGSTPGLQVAGHPDGRPHLAAVQGWTGTQAQQGAVALSLQEPPERKVGCEQKSSVLD